MKKISVGSLLLAVLFTLTAVPVSAAGRLSVVQEKFYVMPYLSYFAGYLYAEVTNTGDKPVDFNDGLLELYNADGDSIESSSYISCYPDILNPGDFGYVAVVQSVEEATSADIIDDYLLTVTGKGVKDRIKVDLEVSDPHYQADDDDSWWRYNYMVADVKNATEDIIYDFYISFALKDSQGNILFTESCNPSYVGLLPGSHIQVRETVDSDIIERLEEEDIKDYVVEAVAYVIVDE